MHTATTLTTASARATKFALALAVTILCPAVCAQGQDRSVATPAPFTLTLETTYRPLNTPADTRTESMQFSPLPLTPDLGLIANSLAAEPSVADAMQKARQRWTQADPAASRDEL
ncbi:hypothetical protein GGI07_004518 [Coemansia sp. Benny D115]|nr:hypothetical protein GGI07_004518 [Coemansia sp. Benny D115]